MARILVAGDPRYRERIATLLERAEDSEIVDCDPSLGDCVMYTRLEGVRYAAFVFVGFDHPVTRGALALVAERSVLVPLVDPGGPEPDPLHDAYLFRLPRALGFRDEDERAAVVEAIPKAASVPSELIGEAPFDASALASLLAHVSGGRWQWANFVAE